MNFTLSFPDDFDDFKNVKAFTLPTLVHFRQRLMAHERSRIAMDAGLEAMRRDGYLRKTGAIRIDSTHVLGAVSAMSRLACVRETLRQALNLLAGLSSFEEWEPWYSRYENRNPAELRKASADTLKATMTQAGKDVLEVLNSVALKMKSAIDKEPVELLRRVFNEQFEVLEGGEITERKSTSSGSVKNPNDPDAGWSTKGSIGKEGWVGYKMQVCETTPDKNCITGEPISAVITSVVTQPAETSDHGSLGPVLDEHKLNGQEVPSEIFTDAGYISADDMKRLPSVAMS